MEKILVKGIQVNYKQEGNGDDVILLHGWGQNIEMMDPLGEELVNNFKVTTIDFPGFGDSDEPTEVWGAYEYTDLLEDIVKELNISKPILIGHSFGGRVSIVYASRNDVEKVILLDSAGVKPKRKLDYYVKVYSYKAAKILISLPFFNRYEDAVKSKFGSSDYKSASSIMRSVLVKVVNEDLTHLMPKIKVPTLLIWGSEDTATPVRDAKIMEKLIPDAGLVLYEGVGHYAYLERLPQVKLVINHFLLEDKEG